MDNYCEHFYKEMVQSGGVFDIALNEWVSENSIVTSDELYRILKFNSDVRRNIAEKAFKQRTRGLNVPPYYLKRQLSQPGSDVMLLNILKTLFESLAKQTVNEARVDPKRKLRLTDLLADLRGWRALMYLIVKI
jgi:hypothetical protein